MSCGRSPRFRAMTGTDPKTTLREFREYFASSYEALGKLAARIGVTHPTLADVLANSPTLARLAKDQIATATRIRRVRLQRGQVKITMIPIPPVDFEDNSFDTTEFRGPCVKCGWTRSSNCSATAKSALSARKEQYDSRPYYYRRHPAGDIRNPGQTIKSLWVGIEIPHVLWLSTINTLLSIITDLPSIHRACLGPSFPGKFRVGCTCFVTAFEYADLAPAHSTASRLVNYKNRVFVKPRMRGYIAPRLGTTMRCGLIRKFR